MLIHINKYLYQKCHEASKYRWSSTKQGSYGKGVLNTTRDPYRTERVGLLGEVAYGKAIGHPEDTDFSYIQGGDNTDFKHNRFKVDIKCASYNAGKSLVIKNANGMEYKVNKDIYVVCYVIKDTKEIADIKMVGWCYKDQVLNSPVEKGTGNWTNYVLYYDKLKPIEELIELVKALDPAKSEKDEFIENWRKNNGKGIHKSP